MGVRAFPYLSSPSSTLAVRSSSRVRLQQPASWLRHATLAGRIAGLTVLFAIELLIITIGLDTERLRGAGGVAGFIFAWGAWVLKAGVAFAVLCAVLEFLRTGSTLKQSLFGPPAAAIDWRLLGAHAATMAMFGALSWVLFLRALPRPASDLLAAGWMAAGLSGILLASLAAVSLSTWRSLARGSGLSAVCALGAAVGGCVLGNAGRQLWHPLTGITFALVKLLLQPLLPVVISDPGTMTLGSPAFQVEIAPACSGFEGAGLMLVFGAVWLALFRKEFRFPQAFLLLPAGVAAAFLLNGVRIAALILIGNAGAEQIALGGFHSQAGWIAFNCLALAFAVGARRVPWVAARTGVEPDLETSAPAKDSAVPAYLLPFLAILAASILTRAATAGFDWLYPVRFAAAAATLWYFRREYRGLNWRFGWAAAVTGAAVFALWIALDRGAPSAAFASSLAAAPPMARIGWMAVRVLAATVTVPIAEELAFRGFLLRRLTAADFESIDPRRFSWLALLVSSLAFGALHGDRWLAGTAAGVAYALAMRRRGRIGDAVAAHGITNLLLAIWVIWRGAWSLW